MSKLPNFIQIFNPVSTVLLGTVGEVRKWGGKRAGGGREEAGGGSEEGRRRAGG